MDISRSIDISVKKCSFAKKFYFEFFHTKSTILDRISFVKTVYIPRTNKILIPTRYRMNMRYAHIRVYLYYVQNNGNFKNAFTKNDLGGVAPRPSHTGEYNMWYTLVI